MTPVRVRQLVSIATLLLSVTTGPIGNVSADALPDALKSQAVATPKQAESLDARTKSFLASRNSATARVWIFFTDKEIDSRRGFEAASTAVTIEPRSLKRRAKVGLDKVVFADLPVSTNYIGGIEQFSGELRRISRWLNAASFDIPMSQLEQVAALPYVAKVTPVHIYKKDQLPSESDRSDTQPPASASPNALNYGNSLAQLNQINVPQLHAEGIDGTGVTLGVFDTGFRKSHQAFALALSEGRLLAEYDFVFNDGNTSNEGADVASAWDHGTYTWSTSGGQRDGSIYGPAYKANFILCKTEDVRSETHTEEDDWVAALEFADSVGVDVITSSLGYFDFDAPQASYTYADMNGLTAIITQAANLASGMGIVLCNSMGNSGPAAGTLSAPADAFDMISVGAVNSSGVIASFSSRGPTFDGRIKPEVCARGVSTYAASATSTTSYASPSGTSLSCPLVAGAACLLIQAHPTFTPALIRQSMMETASKAATPDNTYGSGIINTLAASTWGAQWAADDLIGNAPLTVNFTASSTLSPTSWLWSFGNGDSSSAQNPTYIFQNPGSYTISMTVQTSAGPLTIERASYIVALGDTLSFAKDSVFAGQKIVIPVRLNNSQALNSIIIPFEVGQSQVPVTLDSVRLGSRTNYFEALTVMTSDPLNHRYTYQLTANNGGGAPNLAVGNGEVLRLYCTTGKFALGGLSSPVQSVTIGSFTPEIVTDVTSYPLLAIGGWAATKGILRGDCDYSNDGLIDISDLTRLIDFLFISLAPLPTVQSGDLDADFIIDISDLTYMINFLFIGGPPPVNP